MKIVTILSPCLVLLAGSAAEIPEPILPAGVGVNIHFVTGHENDLDLIAAAGFAALARVSPFTWAFSQASESRVVGPQLANSP